MFARRRLDLEKDTGVVLQIEASPQMIVCANPAHSKYLREHEYLVDPRSIRGVKVLKAYPYPAPVESQDAPPDT